MPYNSLIPNLPFSNKQNVMMGQIISKKSWKRQAMILWTFMLVDLETLNLLGYHGFKTLKTFLCLFKVIDL